MAAFMSKKDYDNQKNAPTYIITQHNEAQNSWDVLFNDELMDTFEDKGSALNLADSLHLVYEAGYVRGLTDSYQDTERADEELANRQIPMMTIFDYDDPDDEDTPDESDERKD